MIYCNNAATTWPKPEVVYEAADRCLREQATALRSSAAGGTALLDDVRSRAAEFFGVSDPSCLAFTPSCTYALNQAVLGLPWKLGDRAIMSGLEHNAVSRPMRRLMEQGVKLEIVPYRPGTPMDLDFLEQNLQRGGVRLVACTMASNVTGEILPVHDVVRLAHQYRALCLIDAAQSAGILPLNISELAADFVGMAGHKGLLSATGVGVLYVRPDLVLTPLIEGGTGGDSGHHPLTREAPARYECGTHNLVAIASLGAGLQWLSETGIERIRLHEQKLVARFLRGVVSLEKVKVFGTTDPKVRTSVVSLTCEGLAPKDLSQKLLERYQICTRAGFHCAPTAHEAIGTCPGQGTIRFSFGYFNTEHEVDQVLQALRELLSLG